MKYLLNCRSFISLMVLFSFFDNFGMKNYDYLFKVVFIGDAGVGKTQIVNKYVGKKFDESYQPTIGVEFETMDAKFKNKKIRLHLWSTAGQENYRAITQIYYKKAQLIAFVYDINTGDSFNSILKWVEEVKTQNKNAKFLLVGNKCDLEEERRVVTKEEANEYAEKNDMKFFEVSAKTGKGIDDMFEYIISELLKDVKEEKTYYDNEYDNEYDNDLSFCDKYFFCCPCLKKSEENVE